MSNPMDGHHTGDTSDQVGDNVVSRMYFHQSRDDLLLFEGWDFDEAWSYTLICFTVILVGVLKEWLYVYRAKLKVHRCFLAC